MVRTAAVRWREELARWAIPDEILNKLQPIFYTDPINAAIRAMGLD